MQLPLIETVVKLIDATGDEDALNEKIYWNCKYGATN